MENEEKTRVNLGMICICREDGRERAKETRDFIMKRVLDDMDPEAVSAGYVSMLIAELWHGFGCSIEGIYMDMWFGISGETKTETIRVQCDEVEDGLAEMVRYFYAKEDAENAD